MGNKNNKQPIVIICLSRFTLIKTRYKIQNRVSSPFFLAYLPVACYKSDKYYLTTL